MDVLMWNREPVGGSFSLVDQSGAPRTDRDFRGKLMLVYFGFTYCPDVCPTDLQAMASAIDGLGADGENVQPIFITLDPERDTSSHLRDYLPMFHPRFVGLTGEIDKIKQAADAYKVYFERAEIGAGDYTVDHSAYIYLMGRRGEYLGFFPPGSAGDRLVEIIRPHINHQ
jgi:protein SCO1/2